MFSLSPLRSIGAPTPAILAEVRAIHEALVAEGRYPDLRTIHARLKHLSARCVRQARATLLEDRVISLPRARNGHHKPVRVLSPVRPRPDRAATLDPDELATRWGVCWREVLEYRAAWRHLHRVAPAAVSEHDERKGCA